MAHILGLDIDQQVVRGVVLRTALRKSEVAAYVAVAIEPTDTEEARLAATMAAINEVRAAVGQPTDRVMTAMDGQSVSIRAVKLPLKALKKLNDLLPFELEGTVPFEISESVIDHQPIAQTADELRMLAAVLPKDRIREHLDEMHAYGVDPREVAVGAVALDGLIPLLPDLATPGPHCIIEIRPHGTDVCLLQDGTCHFARTISVTIDDIDHGQQSRLARELKQTLAAWRLEGGAEPSAFYVAGSMAIRDGTDTWLSQIMGAPVTRLALPAAPGADDAVRPAFSRAAALAGRALVRTRHLDARKGEFVSQKAANALRQHLPALIACAMMILISFVFSSAARYWALDARHEQLEAELATVTQEFFDDETRSPSEARRLLTRGARGADPMPVFDAYDAMAAISATIPETITHDVRQLQIDLGDGEETGRFSLRGTVDSVSDTEAIRQALQEYRLVRQEGETEVRLQCFRELELGAATATAEDRRSYRLEGAIRCLPEGQTGEEEESQGSRRRRRRT